MATKNITLTNLEIYTTAQALMENITTDINLPVKVGFYIQKNMKKIQVDGRLTPFTKTKNKKLAIAFAYMIG